MFLSHMVSREQVEELCPGMGVEAGVEAGVDTALAWNKRKRNSPGSSMKME